MKTKVYEFDAARFPWVADEDTYIDSNDDNKKKVTLDVEYRAQLTEVAPKVQDLIIGAILAEELKMKLEKATLDGT